MWSPAVFARRSLPVVARHVRSTHLRQASLPTVALLAQVLPRPVRVERLIGTRPGPVQPSLIPVKTAPSVPAAPTPAAATPSRSSTAVAPAPLPAPSLVSIRQAATMACAAVPNEKYERLPEFAKPARYTIKLVPDLKKFTFDGEAAIEVDITSATDHLKLHAQALNVSQAGIVLADGKELSSLPVTYDEKWTMLTVKLPQQLTPQKVTLKFKYVGELNDKMRGFYRSSYKAADGSEKFIASTQFESTYARLSFPCWDEPIYKAKFDVTLVVDESLTALSNMNVVSESKVDGGKKSIKFDTSPLMSTYLVAFAVGDFEYLESKTKSGTIMRVYTVPGKKAQGAFGLELATRAIDWYNEWFGIPYALPKCDLIAIPDFSMGAMENWGLVTYREVALLVDPAKSSTRQKSRVALVIAHELAHLWFGDLVTMKWWTDLWLKEGFASFMEYMFVGYNYEEFKIWLHFVNDELAQGFALDALRSSHPIEVEIDNPNELDEIYDSITYAKSNSVNRMLCYYLGEPTFQKGLQLYLQKYKYSNAVTVDLWNALSEASGQDVAALMSGWTKQMGFPVVSVSERQEGDKRILNMTQKRFIADGGDDEKKQMWQVPINICIGSNPSAVHTKVLLKEREQEFVIEGVKPGDWLKLNAGTTGFYRVEYSEAMLKALLPDIASKKMPVLDRFGITNDLFALVEAGRVPASQFLALLEASAAEDEYVVWGAIDGGLSALSNVLDHAGDAGLRKRFDAFVCKVLEPVGARLGWKAEKGEDSQKAMLRSLVQGRLAKAGHAPTIKAAKELFEKHIASGEELHPDLRLTIYSTAIRNGGVAEFDKLIKVFETVGFSEVERHCIVALSQVQDRALIERLFKYGIDQGKIRSQDLMLLFVGVRVGKVGQDFVWPYFKSNLKSLMEKFGGANSSLFQHCLKLSSDYSCKEAMAKEIETFLCSELDAVAVKTLDRPIRQVAESIRLNARLLERNEKAVADFLGTKGI